MPNIKRSHLKEERTSALGSKIKQLNFGLLLLVTVMCGIGVAMLYSAANGNMTPWADRHIQRYLVGLILIIVIALIDLRFLLRCAYLLYALNLILLIAVELIGDIGMGAQRWIDLHFIKLQPSEFMKIVLVIALARYFHGRTVEEVVRPIYLLIPILMVLGPVILVMRQPDLGTAGMILLGGGIIFFLAGVKIWKFVTLLIIAVISIPIAWQFLLDYQKRRILIFLNPEIDPLGAGYHLFQSKIALGSGGLFGKGFLNGSQSHLNFLPEKQTDFVFTMLAEEFGLMGGLTVIILFMGIIAYGYIISFFIQSQFGRLLTLGMTATIFLYVFINIGMVMGIVPIVGVPLPFVSYGGTALLASMSAIGFIINCYVHRNLQISRFSAGLD
ncbi:rod shape-determining protein RodA [Rhodospirillaceae bacterium]|nr:rod shape-determining protein RodA [Rhodospirillaceae bacterium]MBT7730060.1 rod shape-determining protein RodA [Rhodospirillaceae bacterium]MDC0997742.1 rod shape-determining protein RodA [Alphaproteobacteria bacterium]MDC1441898.1 rod shape-determining protein RodA [Rhodospirillaceae bacterium]